MVWLVKAVWNVVVIIAVWFYGISGLEYVVEEIRTAWFNYKLKLRMVPVSYKLFVFFWGVVIGGSGVFVHLEYPTALDDNRIIIENTRIIEPVQAKETVIEVKKEKTIDELADYIWMKESTRGKNNYSKCEEVGKVNGVGYAIPGDGSYVCFDIHDDEMQAVKGWLTVRKALGWSELKMLCTYSGSNYTECKK